MRTIHLRCEALLVALVTIGLGAARPARAASATGGYLFDDCHFHLTNYIQEGITAREFLKIMGNQVGRSTLFGIPLQQQWSYRVDGDNAPKYYLDTDAPLYYYSFTDAYIAMQYRSLAKTEQARFDPMITGFNPTDMYAADHIRRVLRTFPGVFEGIGEFTIQKRTTLPISRRCSSAIPTPRSSGRTWDWGGSSIRSRITWRRSRRC